MQKDAFKPQGREISVMGMGSPMLGQGNMPNRMVPMAQPPAQGRAQAPMMPTPMPRGGAPAVDRSGAFKPMGAQVRLAGGAAPVLEGGPVEQGASFQPSQAAPIVPPPQTEMAGPMPQAPRPFLQRANGAMIVRVVLRGIGPDGAPYDAPYDAEFIPGTHSFSVNFAPLP